jgi:hypothetical protein
LIVLHDIIEVFTERLVPIDLLHIPYLIIKLYVVSLNFVENKKFIYVFIFDVLTPLSALSAIFQPYHGDQF